MEPSAGPSSQRQRTSGGGGSGGGGGACIGDLPDALLSQIFSLTGKASVVGASATLVCKRWHRQFYATSSLWRRLDVFEPEGLKVEQREAWLAAKLRQLRQVSPFVEAIDLCDEGMEMMLDVLQCLRPEALQEFDAGCYGPAVTETAMRVLQRLTRLTGLTLGVGGRAPANCGWALSHLTGLQQLSLDFAGLPADCVVALSGAQRIRDLMLVTSQPLPSVKPLTALSALTRLHLAEEGHPAGLALLNALHFAGLQEASYSSPVLKAGDNRFSAYDGQPGSAQLCGQPSYWHLSFRNMNLLALNSIGQLVQALMPAGEPLRELTVHGCRLSFSHTWNNSGKLLGAVTRLHCISPTAIGSVLPALDAGLQHMTSLRTVDISFSDLSGGVPAALCSLPAISALHLSHCRLASLPHLACMSELETLRLDGNSFTRVPPLGSALRLTRLSLMGNPGLVLDAEAAARLPEEAPALKELHIGGPAAAAVSLAGGMPQLAIV